MDAESRGCHVFAGTHGVDSVHKPTTNEANRILQVTCEVRGPCLAPSKDGELRFVLRAVRRADEPPTWPCRQGTFTHHAGDAFVIDHRPLPAELVRHPPIAVPGN